MSEYCEFCGGEQHNIEHTPIDDIADYPYQVRDLDSEHVERLAITGHPGEFLIHLVRRDDGQEGFFEIGGRHQLEAVYAYNRTAKEEGKQPVLMIRTVLHTNLTTERQIIDAMYRLNLKNARSYNRADQLRHAQWIIDNADRATDGARYWEGQYLSWPLLKQLTGLPVSTLHYHFSQKDDGDTEASERRRASEMRKLWSQAKRAYQWGKSLFSKKMSGAGEKDIIEECRNDPKALNAAKQLAAFFNQVVEKVEKEGK